MAFEPRFWLTDRQRELLQLHACVLADLAYDDIERFGDAPVDPDPSQWWLLFSRLPVCTFAQPAAWRRHVARSFDDLAANIEAGELPRPRTMCEQLALLLILADTAESLEHFDLVPDEVSALRAHDRGNDLESVADGFVDDRDAEAFYERQTAEAWTRIIPLDAWFNARDGEADRNPRRGFRR